MEQQDLLPQENAEMQNQEMNSGASVEAQIPTTQESSAPAEETEMKSAEPAAAEEPATEETPAEEPAKEEAQAVEQPEPAQEPEAPQSAEEMMAEMHQA